MVVKAGALTGVGTSSGASDGGAVVIPESNAVQASLSKLRGMGFLLSRRDIRTAEGLNGHLEMVRDELRKLKLPDDEPLPEKEAEPEPDPEKRKEREAKGGRDRMVRGKGQNRGESG